ncbi:hypothetical protein IAT40_001772 [Kwoniella sp. CBS 6097]
MGQNHHMQSPNGAKPDPPKRKSRSTRGLLNKVQSLEEQLQHVQKGMEGVISLLLRVAPPSLPLSGHSTGLGRHQDVKKVSGSLVTDYVKSAPLDQAQTLEDWIRRVQNPTPDIGPSTSVSQEGGTGQAGETLDSDSNDESEEDQEDLTHDPMYPMRSMLRQDERARLRADGHPRRPSAVSLQLPSPQASGSAHQRKRIRLDSMVTSRPSPLGVETDPIRLGLLSESAAIELFNLFFNGAHSYIPVYDPVGDTLHSLRSRSSFSVTAILFVGQKIKDGANTVSDLQKQLRLQSEEMAKTTLFSPIANIEALQAMVILANWGDTIWRPGAHAVSMAFDMELHRCLPQIAEESRNKGAVGQNTSTKRSLLVGARVWLLVSKLAIEMAFNHGKPLLINEEEIFCCAHALLDYPSRQITDIRVVASMEILRLRIPLLRVKKSDPEEVRDRLLQVYNDNSRSWEDRWRQYFFSQGVGEEDFLVTDLTTQRCFGRVLANACLLSSIRSQQDVELLPAHRRHWLITSLQDAQLIAHRILTVEKAKMVHGNHYSHVCLASIARIYLRLATLFPSIIDLRSVAKDLIGLVEVLAQLPGFRFAQQLRYAVEEARKRRMLPPETRPSSPRNPTAGMARGQATYSSSVRSTDAFSVVTDEPSVDQLWNSARPHGLGEDFAFDFNPLVAEQVLNESSAPGISNQNDYTGLSTDQTTWFQSQVQPVQEPDANSLAWLDFPALDVQNFDHNFPPI